MFAIPWPRRNKARRRPAPARPRLELLEDRAVPVISFVRNLGVNAAVLRDVGYDLTIRVSDTTNRDDRIIVAVGYDLATRPYVTDSQGNTYQDDSRNTGAIFSAQNTHPLGFGDTITVHFKSIFTQGTAAASASEWHGLTPDPLDRTSYGYGSGPNGYGAGPDVTTDPTLPTTQPDELLIGAISVHPLWGDDRHPSLLPGFGYQTLPGDDVIYQGHDGTQGVAILPEYRIVSAIGSYVPDGTITPAMPDPQTGSKWGWEADIATYKAAPDVVQNVHLDVIPDRSTVAAGTPFSVTVIARDDEGNIVTDYAGTVHFSSTDPAATLPPDYPFTPADAGQHTFVNGVTLRTPGAQTITAQDVAVPTITGSATVQVTSPAQSAHLDLIPDRSAMAPGAPFSLTVIARDGAGSVLTNYTGTVRFSSSDPAAGLPPDYAFTPADGGQHTFAGITLWTPGAQSIAAQDMAVPATAGSTAVEVTAPVDHHESTQVIGTQVMQAGNHGRSVYLLVTLNADVDPASAQDLSHYGLFSSVKGHPRRRHQVPLAAALYDPASRTVILTVGKRKATDRRATLVVLGLPGQAGLLAMPVDLGPARRR
jgi:hypothetical protein